MLVAASFSHSRVASIDGRAQISGSRDGAGLLPLFVRRIETAKPEFCMCQGFASSYWVNHDVISEPSHTRHACCLLLSPQYTERNNAARLPQTTRSPMQRLTEHLSAFVAFL